MQHFSHGGMGEGMGALALVLVLVLVLTSQIRHESLPDSTSYCAPQAVQRRRSGAVLSVGVDFDMVLCEI